jgi:hypothetical protein
MHGQDFTIIDQSSRAIHEYQLTTAPMKPSDENSRIPHTAERATTSIRTSPVKLNDFATYDLTHSLAVYSRQCNSPRALTQDPQIRHLHLLRSVISSYVLVDFGS